MMGTIMSLKNVLNEDLLFPQLV